MATHPSAEKRNRQRITRTRRNKVIRTAAKSALKKARAAISQGDGKAAADLVQVASKALARAASKGVLHANAAARTTSRINAALTKLKA